jgi:DNA primase large subunit
MTQSDTTGHKTPSEHMQDSPMMAHLLDALKQGIDIGHYGRLTFVMIAHHFLSDDEIIKMLSHQPDHNVTEANALLQQVKARNYNPPKRERILEWQAQQDFPICPTPDDPGSCNVYQELRFPDDIYENIHNFYEEKAEADQPEHKL